MLHMTPSAEVRWAVFSHIYRNQIVALQNANAFHGSDIQLFANHCMPQKSPIQLLR